MYSWLLLLGNLNVTKAENISYQDNRKTRNEERRNSIFLSQEEINDTKRQIEDKRRILLQAIVYYSHQNWTVWVNNKKINCGDHTDMAINKYSKIIEVSESYILVEVAVPEMEKIKAKITPNNPYFISKSKTN